MARNRSEKLQNRDWSAQDRRWFRFIVFALSGHTDDECYRYFRALHLPWASEFIPMGVDGSTWQHVARHNLARYGLTPGEAARIVSGDPRAAQEAMEKHAT